MPWDSPFFVFFFPVEGGVKAFTSEMQTLYTNLFGWMFSLCSSTFLMISDGFVQWFRWDFVR